MSRSRVAAALAALVLIALAAACAGESNSDGSPSVEMRIAMTDEGCTYEGDETPAGPTFTLNTDNQSSRYVNYGLSRIPERYVDVERERLEDGEAAFFSPPSYFVFVDGGGIGAGISGSAVMETSFQAYTRSGARMSCHRPRST